MSLFHHMSNVLEYLEYTFHCKTWHLGNYYKHMNIHYILGPSQKFPANLPIYAYRFKWLLCLMDMITIPVMLT